MSIIRFKPIYQERVWGGQDLKNILGREIPTGHIGESWEIVDRPEANSVICGSEWDGLSLREALIKDAATILGPNRDGDKPFPILVKWLDCQERLSLQVHPPADVAPELRGEPKTENWYIAAAKPGARLLAGLKNGITRDQFEKALTEDRLEPLVHALPCQAGDSLFVQSGRIHAIDGGNLILEIQQNSDTTYRVYDWGRVGLDGRPRQLHIDESMRSIDFNDFEPSLIHPGEGESILADSAEFRLRRITLTAGENLLFPANDQAKILSVVEGQLQDKSGESIVAGENVLLPYGKEFDFKVTQPLVALVTDRF